MEVSGQLHTQLLFPWGMSPLYPLEVSGQLHTQLLFPWGMRPWYPLDGRLGGHQSWVGHCEEAKNPCLLQIKPKFPSHPAQNLDIILRPIQKISLCLPCWDWMQLVMWLVCYLRPDWQDKRVVFWNTEKPTNTWPLHTDIQNLPTR
jgi:hypothetical protein